MEVSQDSTCTFCGRTRFQVKILIGGGENSQYICDNCVKKCHDLIEGKSDLDDISDDTNNDIIPVVDIPSPSKIRGYLDEYVVGQDAAKIAVSVAAYNHYKRIMYPEPDGVELDKSNILMVGPTGSGKTLIASSLAKFLEVPWAMADATSLTEAGYVGEDVESIVGRLIANANYNVGLAEKGIIFIDEIDKKKSARSASGGRDISGESVQQALLKILEGSEIMVTPPGKKDRVKINTKNILFIVSGAFVGLDKIMNNDRHTIGFSSSKTSPNDMTVSEHLVKFGLIPELVGRLPVVAMLKELDEEQLFYVLTQPKNAITKQFKAMFKLDEVDLEFTESSLRILARKAIANKTGARGLRTLIEESLLHTQYHLPDLRDSGAASIVVFDEVFTEGKSPEVKYNTK